ncbi:MAG: IS200/IS605 family transposase [Saprospiraceae bacterium]|nr:IS200/IS605 family transposase [Saprospiraceae bacterium]
MANTYTQILVQIVFAVRGRRAIISEEMRVPLEKYICGAISNKKSKPLAIYCNPDHCHILIGLHPSISISEMARDIKSNSSRWINENNWLNSRFSWQEGYGAFTYSRSQLNAVVKYILNQKEHHRRSTFREEYLELLKKFEVPFKREYLFDF